MYLLTKSESLAKQSIKVKKAYAEFKKGCWTYAVMGILVQKRYMGIAQLSKRTGLHEDQLKKPLDILIKQGYVQNKEGRYGMIYRKTLMLKHYMKKEGID